MNKGKLNLAAWVLITATSGWAISPLPGFDLSAAEGIRDFGFKTLKALYDGKGTEPVAISPLSLSEALTLLTLGAEKQTKSELERLFANTWLPKGDAEEVSLGVARLRRQLSGYATSSKGAFAFASANALWGNSNSAWEFKFNSDFLDRAKTRYGAKLTEQNFSDSATVDAINVWVNKNTSGKIKELLKKLDTGSVAVLLNAIYAKGRFLIHFSQVAEGGYTLASGKSVAASLIHARSLFGYNETSDLRAVSLAIGNDATDSDQVALDIITAKDGSLDTLMDTLTGDEYVDLVKGFKWDLMDLTIAAGKVEQKEAVEMKGIISGSPFGAERVFDPGLAELGLIGKVTKVRANLFVSNVLTKTFYEVTPFGFEAAAATAVVIRATSIRHPVRDTKILGPSLHIVRHIPTGAPLFMVVYDSPVRYTETQLVDFLAEGAKTDRPISAVTPAGRMIVNPGSDGQKSVVIVDKDGTVTKVLKKL